MRKLTLLFLLVCQQSWALEPSDPTLAVVRIKSHGASGTIIKTETGRSWVLSCAHMFLDQNEKIDPLLINKKIVIDGPAQPNAPAKLAEVKLLFYDTHQDLSLLEIANGPFNFVPVAPSGFKPGTNITSAGYDAMRWPMTHVHATIALTMQDWTYTREKPWHGRSGGGLFDLDAKVLIGVVNGYEVTGQQRGIYVSQDSVLRFLSRFENAVQPPRLRQPYVPQPFMRQGDFCPK